MYMLRYTRVALIAAVLFGIFASTLLAQEPERFTLSGDDVAVYNVAGEVEIEAGTGSSVVVEVRRMGADAGDLRIDRRTVDNRSALIVRYTDDDVVYRGGSWRGNATLNVREDGTFFGRRRGSTDRIRVKSSGSGSEAHADLRILVPAGRSVSMFLGVGRITAHNVSGDLNLDVASASVSTSRTRGALNIDTGSGSVTVSGAEGDVNIDTGSGSVRGDGVTAGLVHIDTGSGSVELRRVASRDVRVDTGSGRVAVDLTADAERVRIDTGSGSVRLAVPADFGAELTVDTGSGGIDVDVPITVRRKSRDRLEGRIGDGRGDVEIDTGSGSVRIVRS